MQYLGFHEMTSFVDKYLAYIYQINMEFEWDEAKKAINKKIHDGIGFEIAVRVFLDEKRIERYDAKHSTPEETEVYYHDYDLR